MCVCVSASDVVVDILGDSSNILQQTIGFDDRKNNIEKRQEKRKKWMVGWMMLHLPTNQSQTHFTNAKKDLLENIILSIHTHTQSKHCGKNHNFPGMKKNWKGKK